MGEYCGGAYGLLEHEKEQNNTISELKDQVLLLSEKIDDLYGSEAENEFVKNVSPERFDYLAIGNSITIHPINDYWFGEWGMAASVQDNDYYHRIVNGLSDITDISEGQYEGTRLKGINSLAYNYYEWELNSHDRGETYSLIDKYLLPEVDLVTVQLSENVYDFSTFELDYIGLINHIKKSCPKSQIILIDDFWDSAKSDLKKSVAEKTHVDFIDLLDIRGKSEYQLGTGAIIYDADRKSYVNEHDGVGMHPNDKGMEVIAERVLERIFE